MITNNEKKILRFLLANFDRDYSINEIAKNIGLAPNGAYEALRKFEERGVLLPKRISNLRSYKINFESVEANKMLELVLIPDYKEPKISYRYNDLKPLKSMTKLCILFGSYITKKEKPNDIDALFAINKADFKRYVQVLDRVKMAMPFKLHDIIQTKGDLIGNLKKRDKVIISAISGGVILWGHEFLVGVIKNVAER